MTSKKIELNNLWVVFAFSFALLMLLLMYWPALSAPLYTTDDQLLILAPQILKAFEWASVKSVFTVGTGADYYPIRDLSYMIDRYFFGDDYFYYRIHQILLLWGTSIFIFFTMIEFMIEKKVALLFSLFWVMHFYHSEMLMWLSGRKDMLAIFFISIATYLWVSGFQKDNNKRKCISVLFFVLSLFSKASFALLPFVLFVYFWFNREGLKDKINLIILSTTLLISLSYSFFQRYFYSHITDMKVIIPFIKRIKLSLTALGKMTLGIFNSSVNAVDFINLEKWGVHNQTYLIWGVVIWGFGIGLLIHALRFKKRDMLILIGTLVLLYIPVCGLLFPHRIFYSVRYFEPILASLVIGTAFLLRKKESTALVITLLALVVFNTWFTSQEAGYWILPSMQKEKALAKTPHNLDQKALWLSDLINEASTRNPDRDRQLQISKLAKELEETCLIGNNDKVSIPCILFYKLGYEVNKSNNKKEEEKKYFLKFRQVLTELNTPQKLVSKYELEHSLFVGVDTNLSAQNYLASLRALTTEDDRILFLSAQCILGKNVQSKKDEFILKNLLIEENIKKYSDLNFASEVKLKLAECHLI